MNSRIFQPTFSTVSSGLGWIARWMLILLLATDLIGSPFHAHHHDGSSAGYASHTSHLSDYAADRANDWGQRVQHVDTDEPGVNGGHSLSALRGASVQVANPEVWVELHGVVPLVAFAGLLLQPEAEALVRWRPGRERVPIPLFRTVPPDGRAPPSLHG